MKIAFVVTLIAVLLHKLRKDRMGDIIRDSSGPLEIIRRKNDRWFEKSYRLPRLLFYELLNLIKLLLQAKNIEMSRRSSGVLWILKFNCNHSFSYHLILDIDR